MGQLIEVVVIMWLIGIVAFAPLGYFIYIFTIGKGEDFGKSNPEDHSVENTGYYKYIDFVMSTLLGGTDSSISDTKASKTSSATASFSSANKPRPRPRPITEITPKKAKNKDKKKSKKKSKK